MALLETLQDDFSVPATSATNWDATGNITYTGGAVVLTGPSVARLASKLAYTCDTTTNNSYLSAKITPTGAGTDFSMSISPGTDSTEAMLHAKIGGNLTATLTDSGGFGLYNQNLGTYNAATMAYLRIRTAATKVYFGYSADGNTWTESTYSGSYGAGVQWKARFSNYATTAGNVVTVDDVNITPPYAGTVAPTSINDAQTVSAPAASLPIDRLQDDFTTGPLDTVKWSTTGIVGSTATVAGGTLNIDTAAGLTNPIGSVRSVAGYSFTGSGVFAKVVPDPTAAGQTTHLRVIPFNASNEVFYFIKTGGNLGAFGCDTTGNVFNSATITYDPVAHAWWKIRHTAGTIYWETSPDGLTWTIRLQHVYAPQVEPYRARMYTQWTGTSTAGTVSFDNVNIAPPYAAPTSTTDVDALGNPGVAATTVATPNPATDTETLGDPTAVLPAVDITATPDGLTDAGTFGPPTGPTPPARPLLETLQDEFNGTTLNPQWTPEYTGVAPGSVAVSGGLLSLTTWVGSAAATVCRITSTSTYTFTGSYGLARMQPDSSAPEQLVNLKIRPPTGGEYFLMQWGADTLNITAKDNTGADVFTPVAVAYNSTTMTYWRIRHTAGNLYFETTPNAITWTVHKTVAYTPTAPAYHLEVGTFFPTAPSQSVSANVHKVNLTPQAMDTLQDDFTGGTLNPARWNSSTGGTAVTVSVSGGTLNFNVAAKASSTHSGTVTSAETYLFANSSLAAQVTPTTASTVPVTGLRVTGGAEQFYMIRSGASSLIMRAFNTSGTQLTTLTATYSASTMPWWRIRHTAGVIYWETAQSDIGPWAIRHQYTYTPVGYAYTAVLDFTWVGATTATVTRFDNVNVVSSVVANPATDPEQFGDPTAAVVTGPPDVTPDPIGDPETLGNPTATFSAPTPAPIGDPIVDPETLGSPDLVLAADDSPTPDSIEDPEGLQGLDVGATDDTAPDPIGDPESFGNPAGTFTAGAQPDGIGDTETFGPPTPIRNNNVVVPDGIPDPGTLGDVQALVTWYPQYFPNSIVDIDLVFRPDSLIFRVVSNWNYGEGIYSDGPYSGSEPIPEPPTPDEIDNLTYGTGTYGYGIYYGTIPAPLPDDPEPTPLLSDIAGLGQPPLHILGIGPWSPTIVWRGLPNYLIDAGKRPARPAMALPPATSKGFTLRLAEGSEARIDLAMRRNEAIVIDEMDTDLWWRRKDPRTKRLEVIGRFNCSHIEMSTSDTGVNMSAQFEDYVTVLGARMVLKYLNPTDDPPTSIWDIHTPVTDILAFALPDNTGLDLSEATGARPYPLGNIIQPYDLPPSATIADLMANLIAISPVAWEWWIETPADVNLPPKLRFVLGERGSDKGVTLLDAGSGPTPIAAWTKNGAADNYANSLYYTGVGTGTGKDAGGGVVEQIDSAIAQYGQRDALYGSTTQGGDIKQIQAGAVRKLDKLADRKPTYTITLTHGFWRGRNHIDVGDTITLILRLNRDVTVTKYRVSEIAVAIDDNGMEDVTLTLGKPRASSDPRSSQSPFMRLLRTLKNYEAPSGAATIPPPED